MSNQIGKTTAESLTASQPEPLLLDIKQVAIALNTCTKTVRRLIIRRQFSPCKAVRKILIPRKQVEEFIKRTCDSRNLD